MSATAMALLGYAAWSLLLVTAIGLLRVSAFLSGRATSNRFAVDGSDIGPFAERLSRAHANCYESLPAFAAIALVALATGSQAITDPLALWLLAARVAQSVVHLVSTASMAINVRFAFFLVQLLIQAWWVVALLRAGA